MAWVVLDNLQRIIRAVPQWIVSPIGNVLVGLSGVMTSSLLARQLGPAGRGHFAEAMLWTNLVLTAGACVNMQAVAFSWAKGGTKAQKHRVLGAAMLGAAMLCLALVPTALLVNAITLGLPGKVSFAPAVLYVLSIPLSLYAFCVFGVLVAERRFVSYWGARLSNALTFLLGLVIATLLGALNVGTAIIATLAGSCVAALLGSKMLPERRALRPKWDPDVLRSMMSFGVRTSMTNLPYQLNVRLDQLLMSIVLPAAQLGLYAAAYSWASLLAFLGAGVSTVMLSRSVAVDPSNSAQVERLVQQFRIIVWITLTAGICAALLAPIGITLLFGREFSASVAPGILLCIASVILNSNLVLHELTRGLGMPEVGMRAEIIGVVATVVLLLLLLRPFGGIGAAIASIVSYAGIGLSMLISISRRLNIRARSFLRPRRSDVDVVLNTVRRTFAGSRTMNASAPTSVGNE